MTEAQIIRRRTIPEVDGGLTSGRPGLHALHRASEEWTASFPIPASLRSSSGGPLGLALDIRVAYAVVAHSAAAHNEPAGGNQRSDRWHVDVTFYEYRILDPGGTELLVWHHQPGQEFLGPDYPHLHVSAAVTARTPVGAAIGYDLDKRHLPTGTVSLAAVVRMLIEEFGGARRLASHPRPGRCPVRHRVIREASITPIVGGGQADCPRSRGNPHRRKVAGNGSARLLKSPSTDRRPQ